MSHHAMLEYNYHTSPTWAKYYRVFCLQWWNPSSKQFHLYRFGIPFYQKYTSQLVYSYLWKYRSILIAIINSHYPSISFFYLLNICDNKKLMCKQVTIHNRINATRANKKGTIWHNFSSSFSNTRWKMKKNPAKNWIITVNFIVLSQIWTL